MSIDGVWIENRIYWTLKQLVSTLYKSLSRTGLCSRSRSLLRCLITAPNCVASSDYVSNGSCPRWLTPFSCSFRAEVTNQSKSYVTIDGQSASLSFRQAHIWGSRPDFYFYHTVAGLLKWGALSDERTCLSFRIAAARRQRYHSRVRVPRDSWPYFTVSDSTLAQPAWPQRYWVPFSLSPVTPRDTVEVFEPASTPGTHWLLNSQRTINSSCSLSADRIEDISLNSSSVVESRSYRYGPRREHCFPLIPFLHVIKLLPSHGRVCLAVP
jgi:hypothetical protein